MPLTTGVNRQMNQTYDFSELAELINTNSYTKNKEGVDAVGRIYQRIFSDLGFYTTSYPRQTIGDHLLFNSSQTGGRRLLLLGHLDTVFPAGTFTDFKEDDDWIYGPGVCDMKGGNHVAIEALRLVKEQHGDIADIDMLLVSDEETGSDDSKHLTKSLAEQYDACLVFEAAGIDDEVVLGRKGVGTFVIDIEGVAAHAGNNYVLGANANLAAAHMVIELTKLTTLEQGTTVNAGKMSGGIGANTISPKAQIIVEVRYTQSTERERLLKALDEIVATEFVTGVKAKLSGGIQRDVMQPSEAQGAFLQQIEALLDERLLTEQRGGVSDANVISGAGVPTIDGFGPFGDGDHTIHERACKKSFARRIEQVGKILLEYNGARQHLTTRKSA